mmetsp:Transcript_3757/g.11598  ORF Transcript_3757/g.11598 Transcript_3757/m.11598 type:complete len:986 (+) Transcript_3757:94-3051(+)
MVRVDLGNGLYKETEHDSSEEAVQFSLSLSSFDKICPRWISLGHKTWGLRLNWVCSLLAIIVLWGFGIWCIADGEGGEVGTNFALAQSWVTQNFTWFYIGTQDIWCLMLIMVCFIPKYGNLRLGGENERPRFGDFTWFALLFTCGVAVGLYYFGVAEPLYFYRQPASWKGYVGAYDYDVKKVALPTDAHRAQQAIFMAIYHWGIHGWVPYILVALVCAIVSFRWGMPMTIRSCFFPLIGNHAYGFLGDLIDALSISTTTFGVCTSLGLGVQQLARGLQFLRDLQPECQPKTLCEASGGTYDLNTYGRSSCTNLPVDAQLKTCKLSYLSDEHIKDTQYTIIWILTLCATMSVLTGLNKGIVTFAKIAFSLGMIVMMIVLLSDNTPYLLNVMVQTTGYYLQYVLLVGFDCEAFQQLSFEFAGPNVNLLWGSDPTNLRQKLMDAGVPTLVSSPDCGNRPNPCSFGIISMGIIAQGAAALVAKGMGPAQANATVSLAALHPGASGIPCGTIPDDSDFGQSGGDDANMLLDASTKDYWNGGFPDFCPKTPFVDVPTWGSCEAHAYLCDAQDLYFGDTSKSFMDWWTIFYWAWWISWAPFVGFFVAKISKGRTVRELILGGFFAPTLFAILWFSVFGGLAIKMERIAELALQERPDWEHAAVDCSEHYSGGVPITPNAKKLAAEGYYMLTCLPKDTQIYHVVEPYGLVSGFLQVMLYVGLIIYFVTSSDSGSYVDDLQSSSGLSEPPIPQKVFWCVTEGAVATGLVASGVEKALRAISIVMGLPFTIVLCHLVLALYRALKKEVGDADILESKRFNTQLLDIFEGFKPMSGSPVPVSKHLKAVVTGLLCPGYAVYASMHRMHPTSKDCGMRESLVYGVLAQLLYIAWIVLMICEVKFEYASSIAWLLYLFKTILLTYCRTAMRNKYNIWGCTLDDMWACLVWYPFVCAQLQIQAETDGEGAQAYFADVDAAILVNTRSEAAKENRVAKSVA